MTLLGVGLESRPAVVEKTKPMSGIGAPAWFTAFALIKAVPPQCSALGVAVMPTSRLLFVELAQFTFRVCGGVGGRPAADAVIVTNPTKPGEAVYVAVP